MVRLMVIGSQRVDKSKKSPTFGATLTYSCIHCGINVDQKSGYATTHFSKLGWRWDKGGGSAEGAEVAEGGRVNEKKELRF